MADLNEVLTALARLVLAAVLGGAIGLEREAHARFAGLRTNILVAVGSALLMQVSLHLATLYSGQTAESVVRVDPGRIASYCVAGIGFIGGGAIIKGGSTIRGLPTAASLWMVTGLGLAVGAGYYLPPLAATAIALVVLYSLRRLRLSGEAYNVLVLTFQAQERSLKKVQEVLAAQPKVRIDFVNFNENFETGTVRYRLQLRTRKNAPFGRIVSQLSGLPGLKEIAWEKGEVI